MTTGLSKSSLDSGRNRRFIGNMSEDGKAKEWIEIKNLEKDFIREFQFVSEQARKTRRDSISLRLQCWFLVGMLVLVVLLLYLEGF
jgi:hypothetical protein